jgi:hypothetical protein
MEVIGEVFVRVRQKPSATLLKKGKWLDSTSKGATDKWETMEFGGIPWGICICL